MQVLSQSLWCICSGKLSLRIVVALILVVIVVQRKMLPILRSLDTIQRFHTKHHMEKRHHAKNFRIGLNRVRIESSFSRLLPEARAATLLTERVAVYPSLWIIHSLQTSSCIVCPSSMLLLECCNDSIRKTADRIDMQLLSHDISLNIKSRRISFAYSFKIYHHWQ